MTRFTSLRLHDRPVLAGIVIAGCALAAVAGHRAPSWAFAQIDGGQETNQASPPQVPAVTPDAPQQDATAKPNVPLTPEDEAALAEGKAMFRGLCSGCHGGAGRGGKGPDLTDERWIHGNTDEAIAKVIENGVPKTTMKKLGESLKEEQIAKIIRYIRTLARGPGESDWSPYITGDPAAGRTYFFNEKSKVPCSKCHAVQGKGGRIGPSLDRIASRRSPSYIMESIVLPSKDIDPRYEQLLVVTDRGLTLKGLRVNETNFSLQLREENGRFHSLFKRDLEEIQVLKNSIMPNNLAENMTVKELHDVFAFLMTLE